MKKIVLVFLVLAMIFQIVACNGTPSLPLGDNGSVGFYREWGATEDGVKHDTFALIDPNSPTGESTGGRLDADGNWMAQWIYTGKRSTVLCEVDNVELSAGYYKFVCNTSIGNVDVAFSMYTHDVVAELRVQESGTGRNIAFRSVMMEEFEVADVFQDVELYFYVPEDTSVDVFICAKNKIKNTVSSLRIEGITQLEYIVPDYEYFLSESEDDKKIEFEDNALYVLNLWDYIAPLTDTTVAYDVVSIATALQGIVNRGAQRIFYLYVENSSANGAHFYDGNVDKYWLDELTKEGAELSNKKIVYVDLLGVLLRLFKNYYNGLAVWEEAIPATYNVALTASGVDNLLPVRYDADPYSLHSILVDTFGISEKLNLYGKFNGKGTIWGTNIPSTGSKKNDPYLWAKEKYLDTGKTNPTLMANFMDAATMDVTWELGEQVSMYDDLQQILGTNKDYYIQNRAFFFDLSCYSEYLPGDDRGQKLGTDFNTLTQILEKQNELAGDEFIEIGGFVCWWYGKYTDAMGLYPELPQAVPAEWRWSEVFGFYNAVTHADASGGSSGGGGTGPFSNASVYSQIEQLDSYKQTGNSEKWFNAETNRLENVDLDLQNFNYVCIYMGDFDSAAWMNHFMITEYFNDPHRGDLPLCWPIVTCNANRAPHVINRMYQQATEQDYFTAGDNGFGYNHIGSYISEKRPTKADGSPLNGSLETYSKRTAYEFAKFDIDLHSFYLSTEGENEITDKMMAKLTPKGIMANFARSGEYGELIDINDTPNILDDDVPFIPLSGLGTNSGYWFQQTLGANPSRPTFTAYRAVCVSPSDIYNGASSLQSTYKMRVVDPYTFMKLYKEAVIRGLC